MSSAKREDKFFPPVLTSDWVEDVRSQFDPSKSAAAATNPTFDKEKLRELFCEVRWVCMAGTAYQYQFDPLFEV